MPEQWDAIYFRSPLPFLKCIWLSQGFREQHTLHPFFQVEMVNKIGMVFGFLIQMVTLICVFYSLVIRERTGLFGDLLSCAWGAGRDGTCFCSSSLSLPWRKLCESNESCPCVPSFQIEFYIGGGEIIPFKKKCFLCVCLGILSIF